jgi:hypothetical protein
MAGVEPRFRSVETDDPVRYLVSANLKRRHLTTSERAMIAARLATMKQGARTDLAQLCALSQAQAAQLMRVSRRSVQLARRAMEQGRPGGAAVIPLHPRRPARHWPSASEMKGSGKPVEFEVRPFVSDAAAYAWHDAKRARGDEPDAVTWTDEGRPYLGDPGRDDSEARRAGDAAVAAVEALAHTLDVEFDVATLAHELTVMARVRAALQHLEFRVAERQWNAKMVRLGAPVRPWRAT